MPRQTKPLTNTQVDKSKHKDKSYKLNDGNGLYLFVTNKGSKLWRVDFINPISKKRQTYSVGIYPDISLKDAREACLRVKQLVAQGKDPLGYEKQQTSIKEAQSITFKELSKEWLADRAKEDKKDSENIRRLKANIYPMVGHMPYIGLTKEILQEKVMQPIIDREAYHEAKRNKDIIKLVFDYAIDKYEVISINPALKLRHPKGKPGHFDALSEEHEFKKFVQDAWAYRTNFPRANIHTDCLLKLSVLIFARPAEIRTLTWEQYDKKQGLLTLNVSKLNVKHIVPLVKQTQAIMDVLEENKRCDTYVFPTHVSGKKQPLSDGVIRTALKKLGYKGKQTAHGFRSSARTLLDEELEENTTYIENQITHKNQDAHKGAYNRSKYLRQRKRILQIWSDYVEALVNNDDVSKFKKINLIGFDIITILSNLISSEAVTKEDLFKIIGDIAD